MSLADAHNSVHARAAAFLKVFLLGSILSGLMACQDSEMRDLREFVATAYQDKKPEIEPLPEIQPYKGFAYAAAEKEDPFSFENIVTGRADNAVVAGDSPDTNRRREPLERYPLDALKLVGTMTQRQKPWVIVQTSEGTAHRATIGNYMGQNDGKIVDIITEEQRVLLAELVLDPAGRWVTREVEITIDE
ncbi:MAG: pilus assembly protein PilP [Gammaproteobacteria bacterium]|nr:pilus assembly protein PilP [Gammaproteobacteria bacterium]